MFRTTSRDRGETASCRTCSPREDALRLTQAVENLKHRALLMLLYSAGLRVGEVVRLRLQDLDAARKVIRVRGGKGRKDRYTLLADRALAAVRFYVA